MFFCIILCKIRLFLLKNRNDLLRIYFYGNYYVGIISLISNQSARSVTLFHIHSFLQTLKCIQNKTCRRYYRLLSPIYICSLYELGWTHPSPPKPLCALGIYGWPHISLQRSVKVITYVITLKCHIGMYIWFIVELFYSKLP